MPRRPITADDLLTIQWVSDPQISPDGSRILFSRKTAGEKNDYVTHLFTVDVSTREVRQWTQVKGGAGHGRWSPDGRAIAFVSGRDKPAGQIYVLSADGGDARKLSKLPEGNVQTFRWSPDGRWIAFTFREQHPDLTTEAAKARRETGLSDPPWVIDHLWYRLDGDGYFGGQRHRLYVLDVATGEHRMLYDRDELGGYSFDWLPDSSGLVVAHSVAKRPLFERPNDQLFVVRLKGKPTPIKGLAKGSKHAVRVSPDGQRVAFLGDSDAPEVWGDRNNRLYVAPITGGAQTELTAGDDYCLTVWTLSDVEAGGGSPVVEWAPDGKSIYVAVGWHGAVQVGRVDAQKGGVVLLTEGPHVAAPGNLSADGLRLACTWADPTHLAEVALFEPTGKAKAPTVLTDLNAGWHAGIETIAPVEVWIDSADGAKVHAWVLRPPKAKGRIPAILEIHGGPHAQYGWAPFHEFQLLAAQGYAVVYSNPRGSKGYGEAWTSAIRHDWGVKDWADIAAVRDWMKAQSWIDPERLGVMGGSYGGYLTNWVIGHTDDFRAAITDRCVSNLLSMSGSADFPCNRGDYFGASHFGPWEQLEPIWRQSPISHFHRVKTPTLVIHSEGDLRCNVEQGEQVFAALQALGVESRFVRYPASSSHGLSRNGPLDLRRHRLGEIVAWWKRHLK